MRRFSLVCLSVVAVGCNKGQGVTGIEGHLEVTGTVDGGSSEDFGQSCPGFSVEKTLTIANVGGGAGTITGVTAGGDFSLASTPTLPSPIGPQGTLALHITFAPTASQSGGQSGTLTITSTDTDNGTLTVTLTGTVSSAPPTPTFVSSCAVGDAGRSPCPILDFNSVAVGSSAKEVVTVQNTGCPPLTLGAGIDQDGGTFALGAFPSSLQLGDSFQMPITFSPTGESFSSGTLVFSTNDPQGAPGQPAGQFIVNLAGVGAAAVLSLSPASWSAQGGQFLGQTFTVHNGGGASIILDAPGVAENDDAGIFQLDAGWGANFSLNAGSDVSCVVTADEMGSGVYGAQLVIPYGSGSQLTAQLTTSQLANLCTDPPLVFDAGLLCGPPVTEDLHVFVCDGGTGSVQISSIAVNPNPQNDYTLTLPSPTTGPWTVTPGAGISVGVTFKNTGDLLQVNSEVQIDSNAASQATLNVPIANTPAYVPPATGVPALVDGGPTIVGRQLLFQVQPVGTPNYAYQFYWLGTPAAGLDGGLTVLSGVTGADMAFTPFVATSGTASYKICVDEVEADAGAGSCGFDAGTGDGRNSACYLLTNVSG